MKYEIIVEGKGKRANRWFVEAKNMDEAARKVLPPNDDYFEYDATKLDKGRYQPHRRLKRPDALGFTNRKRIPVGKWTKHGPAYSIRRAT